MKYPKLFIPGPTHVPEDVLQAMAHPQIGHRTPEVSVLIKDIVKGIQNLLYTKNRILLTYKKNYRIFGALNLKKTTDFLQKKIEDDPFFLINNKSKKWLKKFCIKKKRGITYSDFEK